ncbi:MAG: hypothetical protein K2P58_09505 [Hyphomonadaceae bacterium]|nr:hypothetical protein [Hyphomonadaceae bacterium]
MRRANYAEGVVAAVAIFAICAAWLAAPHLPQWFARFFGSAPPALCIAGLGVAALVLTPLLKRRGWWGAFRLEMLLVVPLLVAGFALAITVADRLAGFPPDLNAPLPWSLLYYPAMGFAAQVGLHLVPLAAIVLWAPRFAQARPWMTMAAASAPEAMLQVMSSESTVAAFVAAHLVLFGVTELLLLRRYGFIAMYAFRLGYYLYWHILWAAWRAG